MLLEWVDPLMGCGSWIPQLLDIAGAACVFGSHQAKARPGPFAKACTGQHGFTGNNWVPAASMLLPLAADL